VNKRDLGKGGQMTVRKNNMDGSNNIGTGGSGRKKFHREKHLLQCNLQDSWGAECPSSKTDGLIKAYPGGGTVNLANNGATSNSQ